MKKTYISSIFTLIFSLLPLIIFAQGLMLEKLSRWDDNANIDPIGNQFYNDNWGYVDSNGREYAIVGSVDGTYFVDITDPENPQMIDKVDGRWHRCINRDIKTYKHYSITVGDQGNSSLQIVDLQYLPDSVHLVYDSDSLVLRTHNIFVENDYLYLASHTASNDEYYPMSVLSLEDPANPVVVSRLIPPTIDGNPMFDHVHDVHVRNDTAYCSVGNSGLFVYDFSKDRANPVLISALTHYPQAGYNHSSWLNPQGDILVFADETHGTELKVYDVSNPKSMKFLSTFGKNARDGSVVHNPYIKDSLIYTSYYHEGVVVFDMSDPENIKEVAFYDTYPDNIQEDGSRSYSGYNGCWGVYPYLPSGNIIATDMTHGLFILNLREIGTSVNEQAELNSRLKSYPNPFENYFEIEFDASQQKVASFEVFDITGKSYQKLKVNLIPGKNHIRFEEMNALQAGMYFVKVITPYNSTSIKIIK